MHINRDLIEASTMESAVVNFVKGIPDGIPLNKGYLEKAAKAYAVGVEMPLN